MQRIKVEQATLDMVIAQPVENSSGQVLCAKGTALTDALIMRLERLDITHVTVEGHPVDDGKPVKTLEEDLADLDHRYRSVMDNKLMAALKMVVQKHIKKKHEELADEKARMEALNASEEEPSEA
ncbi:MAG: hypothetical protein HOC91_10300 [Nitrospinaceae bacterium]|jgi:hypothetical protein|nr:hypothetical protein [Nitrospinaceae bacterium]MBT3434758.1 hypothetical protein [Nitrospinaceae bacterium]MBT3823068.1 hypothetical protein [Nitrospinaceae bacterium]MBT4095847.1 hypothetical protein [Nitrospinaceae bacterium]MBT4430894.1 hypothetical protein [Nitrospinaceae bacterium]